MTNLNFKPAPWWEQIILELRASVAYGLQCLADALEPDRRYNQGEQRWPVRDEQPEVNDVWAEDCILWRGAVLTGTYLHWCPEWDDLPIDETCPEFPCDCGFQKWVDDGRPEEALSGISDEETN